jgi:hypothetical protein
MMHEVWVAERDDGIVVVINCPVLPYEVLGFVVFLDDREHQARCPARGRRFAVISNPVSNTCDSRRLIRWIIVDITYHQVLAGLSVVNLSKEAQPV